MDLMSTDESGQQLLTAYYFNHFHPKQRREARKQEQANNPFYIKSSPSSQKVPNRLTK